MIAELFVGALQIYLAFGFAFAVPFVWRGVGRLDATAAHGTWGFRALILPGAVLLWPWLAWRLFRRAS